MSGTQATQILEAVAKAAEAASQAAIALREANEQSRQSKTGFSEASTVVQCPKEFGCATSADDQALWSDFAFSFSQWLFFADPAYEPQSRPVATAYSDVRVGCASRLMSCTYPVFTTRVYCAHLPPRYASSRAVVLVAAEDLATSNLEVS